jgi:hypothetical protein
MDRSSFCPIDSGLSAVKLRPELLMSIVRPDPCSSGPRRPATLYRTSRFSGKRTLVRRSELGPFGSLTLRTIRLSITASLGQDRLSEQYGLYRLTYWELGTRNGKTFSR